MLGSLAAGPAQPVQEHVLVPGAPLHVERMHPGEPLRVRPSVDGTVHVWATSHAIVPELTLSPLDVGEPTRAVRAEAGSPCSLSMDLDADRVLDVVVEGAGTGPVTVHVALSAADQRDDGALRAARDAQSGVRELLSEGELDAASVLLIDATELLEGMLSATDSRQVFTAFSSLVSGEQVAGIAPLSALESLRAHCERVLPPGHADRIAARYRLAASLSLRGDVAGAVREHDLAWEEAGGDSCQADPKLARLACLLGFQLWAAGQPREALEVLEPACDLLDARVPELDADRFWCRQNQACALTDVGEVQRALDLWESLVPIADQVRLPYDPGRTWVRAGFARTLRKAGELDRGAQMEEGVLVERLGMLSPDQEAVLWAKMGLAQTLSEQGRYPRARDLFEEVVDARERSLPADHLDLARARADLAAVLFGLGQYDRVLELQQEVLAVLRRTLSPGNGETFTAQVNLAVTLDLLGRSSEALALQEQLLERVERDAPADDPALGGLLSNTAMTLKHLGDLPRALTLAERAARIAARHAGGESIVTIRAQQMLADVLHDLGNFAAQRDVLQACLATASRTLPEESPRLIELRGNLAHCWSHLGDGDRAIALLESAHPGLRDASNLQSREAQQACFALAGLYLRRGRAEETVVLIGRVVERYSAALGERHPWTRGARILLAEGLAAHGELDRAREQLELSLQGSTEEDPSSRTRMRRALQVLALIAAQQGEWEPAVAAMGRALAIAGLQQSEAWQTLAPHELESLDADLSRAYYDALSLLALCQDGFGQEALNTEVFELVEALRSSSLVAASATTASFDDPEVSGLRTLARSASEVMVGLAQGGGDGTLLRESIARRDQALRELAQRLREEPRLQHILVQPTAAALGQRVAEDEALVAFVSHWRRSNGREAFAGGGEPALAAFVLRAGPVLARVDLGFLAAIDASVESWRSDLSSPVERGAAVVEASAADPARSSGARLRELVLDPLLPHLAGARRITVALDGVLHAVPLDALPMGDGLVGDSLRIAVRPTLQEMLWPPRPAADGELVALGGATFNAEPEGKQVEPDPVELEPFAGISRGGAWQRGFPPLPHTASEALGLAELYREVFGPEAGATVLLREEASRESVERLTPRARWLHLATHGWFAPESVRTLDEALLTDAKLGIEIGATREEQVRGSSPMVLCGLAFAGANREPDASGRLPGLLTAEELSRFDLSDCELAVLSACDTNVGVRRAGQGVASLQKALHMAGARSVITSLWRVPDEATKELMLDFYRRMWVEKKPKAQALWEAKMRLRAARDPDGRPLYSTRDWAGWVLTGEPE